MNQVEVAPKQQSGVDLCVEWIKAGYIEQRPTINKNMSSYGMKSLVETWSEQYVTNDEFIQAMLNCGYRAQQTSRGSPNFFFNWKYCKGHDWYSVQNK